MSALLALFVLVAVALPLLLYVFVERETADPEILNRSEAERLARERGGRRNANQADGRPTGNRERSDRQTANPERDHPDEWGGESRWDSRFRD